MEKDFNDLPDFEREFIANVKTGLASVRQSSYNRALAEQRNQILGLDLVERELLRVEIRNDCKRIRGEIRDIEEEYLEAHKTANKLVPIILIFGAMLFGLLISGNLWLLLMMPAYVVVYLITDRLHAMYLTSKLYDLFWEYGYLEGSEMLADWRGISAHEIDDLPDL